MLAFFMVVHKFMLTYLWHTLICLPFGSISIHIIPFTVVPLVCTNPLVAALHSLICPLILACRALPCPAVVFLHLYPASPYAPGSNASGFVAVAFSALPVSLMLPVPSAREGIMPVGSGVPFHSHASTLEDLASFGLAVVTVYVSPKSLVSLGLCTLV